MDASIAAVSNYSFDQPVTYLNLNGTITDSAGAWFPQALSETFGAPAAKLGFPIDQPVYTSEPVYFTHSEALPPSTFEANPNFNWEPFLPATTTVLQTDEGFYTHSENSNRSSVFGPEEILARDLRSDIFINDVMFNAAASSVQIDNDYKLLSGPPSTVMMMDELPSVSLNEVEQEFTSDNYSNPQNGFAAAGPFAQSMESGDSTGAKRATRYFWQYNIQRKGPKVCLPHHKPDPFGPHTVDPHHLKKKADPVFNPEIVSSAEWKGIRVKHNGKARQGDGNDLTPDPKKLNRIGEELRKLNQTIYALDEDLEDPRKKNNARRVKNKLASRVCRLKKKAQHEANKIKLSGLEDQHREYLRVLQFCRQVVVSKTHQVLQGQPVSESISLLIKQFEDQNLRTFCLGRTAEFVEDQLAIAAHAQRDQRRRQRA